MRVRSRAVFNEIFPGEVKKELSEYLSGINSEQVTGIIMKVINASNYNSDWNDWRKLLFEKWFHGENLVLAELIFRRVTIIQRTKMTDQRPGSYLFLTKTCTLSLLEEILKTEYNGSQKSDLEIEVDLFKAILIINERFDPDGGFPIIEEEGLRKILTKEVMLALTSGFSQAVINNNNYLYLLPLFVCQVRKAVYLFDFLEINNPDLLKRFINKYNCIDSSTYIKNLWKIGLLVLANKRKGLHSDSHFLSLKFGTEDFIIKSFVREIMISSEVIEDEDVDFTQLRSKPMIEYQENAYTVINETFVIQKIYDSVYFDLNKIYGDTFQKSDTTKRKLNFRSYFTYEFSEKTLTYKLLEKIYNKRSYIRFSGKQIDNFMEGGLDYYMRNGNKIFLFESKDNLLSKEVKQSMKFETMKNVIDNKLVETVGIPQIINNVKFILDRKYEFDKKYNEKKCHIYPIILTHRIEFDNPGLNYYLKYIFSEKIKSLKKEGYNVSGVKELTLMNIDTLIVHSESLRSGKISLDNAIDSYHYSINKEIKHIKTDNHFEEKVSTKLASFYTYINYIFLPKKNIDLRKQLDLVRKQDMKKLDDNYLD